MTTKTHNSSRTQTIGLLGILAVIIGAVLMWMGSSRANAALAGRDFSLSGAVAISNAGIFVLIFGIALIVAGLALWARQKAV